MFWSRGIDQNRLSRAMPQRREPCRTSNLWRKLTSEREPEQLEITQLDFGCCLQLFSSACSPSRAVAVLQAHAMIAARLHRRFSEGAVEIGRLEAFGKLRRQCR